MSLHLLGVYLIVTTEPLLSYMFSCLFNVKGSRQPPGTDLVAGSKMSCGKRLIRIEIPLRRSGKHPRPNGDQEFQNRGFVLRTWDQCMSRVARGSTERFGPKKKK